MMFSLSHGSEPKHVLPSFSLTASLNMVDMLFHIVTSECTPFLLDALKLHNLWVQLVDDWTDLYYYAHVAYGRMA